jgi:hypothetical protein
LREWTGYRAPSFSIRHRRNPWALDCIARTPATVYSSSMYPVKHDHYGIPDAPRFPVRVAWPMGSPRVPITTLNARSGGIGRGAVAASSVSCRTPLSRWLIGRVNAVSTGDQRSSTCIRGRWTPISHGSHEAERQVALPSLRQSAIVPSARLRAPAGRLFAGGASTEVFLSNQPDASACRSGGRLVENANAPIKPSSEFSHLNDEKRWDDFRPCLSRRRPSFISPGGREIVRSASFHHRTRFLFR